MSIFKTAGTKFFISPTSVITDTINAMTNEDALAYFDAINDWIEVEEIEQFGEIGDTASPITFTAVGNRRVRKLKGPRDAGTQQIVVGRDPNDDGQEQLILSEQDDYNYPFKIELADKASPSFDPSVLYYAGLVMSRPTTLGDVNAVMRRTFSVAINTGLYEVKTAAQSVPVNIAKPSIKGNSLAQAAVLTADEGIWSNYPNTFTYQWQGDTSGNGTFVSISGALGKTYTLAAGQSGDAVRVQVTAHNTAGVSTAANSLPVGLVGA